MKADQKVDQLDAYLAALMVVQMVVPTVESSVAWRGDSMAHH